MCRILNTRLQQDTFVSKRRSTQNELLGSIM